MNEFIATYPQAPAALLGLGLLWLGLGFWLRLRPVGDDLGARLDALSVAWVTEAPPADRFERFEHRDYSGDRGPVIRREMPGYIPVPVMPDIFDETINWFRTQRERR